MSQSNLAVEPVSGTPLLLTIEEAGRLLGQSRSGIYRLCAAGRLQLVHPSPKTSRVPRSSVEALVAELIAEAPTNGSPTAAEAIGLPATSAEQGQDARPA
ncbi:MAG TPA: helix-turn-helix domain-containing protein [Solirubrobacteraceae bacterium]|jgi:excisionase family DNA binding protein|nr:helix-turn-helix domain-containing protein [Solirubrobacteraceae bacterium]